VELLRQARSLTRRALICIAYVLTHLATLFFAVCMGRVRWLGRGASRAFVIVNLLFLFLIIIKGLFYPDPTARSAPWCLNLGFIAGIPSSPSSLFFKNRWKDEEENEQEFSKPTSDRLPHSSRRLIVLTGCYELPSHCRGDVL
jgi:hypothetical protein